jgi:hypothetical protein
MFLYQIYKYFKKLLENRKSFSCYQYYSNNIFYLFNECINQYLFKNYSNNFMDKYTVDYIIGYIIDDLTELKYLYDGDKLDFILAYENSVTDICAIFYNIKIHYDGNITHVKFSKIYEIKIKK